ncbi:hypothetical protein SPHINGOAX6_71006 [Sphingomonas sp. AX6]|nr:hypothetical protein SPHINGOAX6_71006 [Sphingomonas sp. AX6]
MRPKANHECLQRGAGPRLYGSFDDAILVIGNVVAFIQPDDEGTGLRVINHGRWGRWQQWSLLERIQFRRHPSKA